ncbi:MAG: neutral/alkaline non-lysosomal ceramidase N-terminal domain-containing protein [Planctomycetes bacterium]|nr:neutral/alkaline non-lysosomal ceramidase N-terminal domain-containing protein [Planctomycetota bacterium]
MHDTGQAIRRLMLGIGLGLALTRGAVAQPTGCLVGVARLDITPDYPIRLSGYGARRTESTGVEQRIWAKALAIGDTADDVAVLLAVESCVVPASVTEKVAEHVERQAGVSRERFVLCCTHTHTAPCLSGALATIFGEPVPPEHQARIDRYTAWLIERLQQVSMAALANRRPARLDWAQGKAGFAMNRRLARPDGSIQMAPNPKGPVDHAVPVLRVTDAQGGLIALAANYACHCTTLGSNDMKICGDWAGYAQEFVERNHPGVLCLVTVGCGADANPEPRLKLEYAKQHGQAVADEIDRLLAGKLSPVSGPPACRFERIELPFEKIPDRQEWEKRARLQTPVGYHARLQLARLDRGESLPTELPYPVQTWAFGRELAMVFLGGEVVVDYSLRLKKQFDPDRLWVTAYANDVPCYIPSRRVLKEGGYEAADSMIYYDRPTRLGGEVEELIAAAVDRLMPKAFASQPSE